jgi:hypothetical protein
MAEAVKDAVNAAKDGLKQLNIADKQKQPKKEKVKKGANNANGSDALATPAEYIDHRIKIFDKLLEKYNEELSKKPREAITITLKVICNPPTNIHTPYLLCSRMAALDQGNRGKPRQARLCAALVNLSAKGSVSSWYQIRT